MPSTEALWGPTPTETSGTYLNREGVDLVLSQAGLQKQMSNIEKDIKNIQENANLSDTEKLFSMQMATNSWQLIAGMRTGWIKGVADIGKEIVRNSA